MVTPITSTLQCTCKYLQHLEILVSKLVPVLPIRCTPTLTCITSTLTSYKYYQYADMDTAFSDMCLRVCSKLQLSLSLSFSFSLKGKGKASLGQTGKGKAPAPDKLTRHTHRAHARTTRNDFPVELSPPSSDHSATVYVTERVLVFPYCVGQRLQPVQYYNFVRGRVDDRSRFHIPKGFQPGIYMPGPHISSVRPQVATVTV